jgi:hypothetical protein
MLNWANVYLLSGAMLNWTNVSSLFLSHLVYSRRCLALVFFCVTLSPWCSLVCLHHQNSFDMDTAPASMPWLASRCGSPTYAGPGPISYRKKKSLLILSFGAIGRPWGHDARFCLWLRVSAASSSAKVELAKRHFDSRCPVPPPGPSAGHRAELRSCSSARSLPPSRARLPPRRALLPTVLHPIVAHAAPPSLASRRR